jgi:hypothetical protein
MLLTMLLFALGNIPLLAWIKGRTLQSDDSSYSMHNAARYGSISRDSTGNTVENASESPAARDLNWFERMDVSVLRQVFRRSVS